MKKVYESFEEIANDFKDGEHWTHQLSDHTSDDCFAWQHGVSEFAKFLDACGVKIIKNTKIHDTLWDDMRTFKPEKFSKCVKR